MKRTLITVVVLGLIGGMLTGVPAEAKKKKVIKRVVEFEYSHPGIGVAPLGGYPATFPAPMEIATSSKETFFKVEVEDASGQKVWGFISQGDLNGNGVGDDGYGTFCGSHPSYLALAAPGTPIVGIYIYSGVCDTGEPSVMTTGTVKITLTNSPV